jgi:hypothetical protein
MRSRCTWSPRSNCLRALTRQSDAIVGHQTARRFCPTGKSLPACRNRLSTFSCKNISLHPDGQIRGITPPVSPKRGAGRDRHERGLRCGGRGSVGAQEVVAGRVSRERSASAQTNGAKARRSLLAKPGCCVRRRRVVLASVADVKLAEMRRPDRAQTSLNPQATVTKRNSSPGRARYKP